MILADQADEAALDLDQVGAENAGLVGRIGGLQDAVVDGVQGRLLPPGDPAAWAEAIRSLADDRKLLRGYIAATGGQARGFAAMANDLSNIYSEAAQGPGRP